MATIKCSNCKRTVPERAGPYKWICGAEILVERSPAFGKNISEHMRNKRARLNKRKGN